MKLPQADLQYMAEQIAHLVAQYHAPMVDAPTAARLLCISERKLWQLQRDGHLPCVRVGRCVRYRRADLDAFVGKLDRSSKP